MTSQIYFSVACCSFAFPQKRALQSELYLPILIKKATNLVPCVVRASIYRRGAGLLQARWLLALRQLLLVREWSHFLFLKYSLSFSSVLITHITVARLHLLSGLALPKFWRPQQVLFGCSVLDKHPQTLIANEMPTGQ